MLSLDSCSHSHALKDHSSKKKVHRYFLPSVRKMPMPSKLAVLGLHGWWLCSLGILIFNYVNKKENELFGLRDVQPVKPLHHTVKTGAQSPRTHITKIKVSNPHNREAETGRSLGLTGEATWLNGQAPSSSERLCLKEQHGWRLTPEADHWSPHACMHACTCTYMISRKHAHMPIYQ